MPFKTMGWGLLRNTRLFQAGVAGRCPSALPVREGGQAGHGTAGKWVWLGGAGCPASKIRNHAKLRHARGSLAGCSPWGVCF